MKSAAAVGTRGPDGHAYECNHLDQYHVPTNFDTAGRSSFPLLAPRQAFAATSPSQFPAKQPEGIYPRGLPSGNGLIPSNPTPNGGLRGNFREINGVLRGLQDRAQAADQTPQSYIPSTNPATSNHLEKTQTLSPKTTQKTSTSPARTINIMSSSTSSSTYNKGVDNGSIQARYRPRSSIPPRMPAAVYAQQCVAAAYASRLNPYALHKKEQELLQDHMCHLHVTVYSNIRNGILRLWTRNPMLSVSKEEAMGCAKDYRWMNLASFAYEFLVRNGYINFGCIEIPVSPAPPKKGRRRDGPVIVVIGAGMAGLGCARHLEGLFNHYHDPLTSPRVIVLEGRRRIGGRIYSHPLRSLQSSTLAPGLVPKAEMGAQIIVGFDHGNPLDQIIRGQLALPYHLLRDISTIYDIDGSAVDEARDATDEMLYNDILDRSGNYRHKSVIVPTAEGDRDLIDSGRDVSTSDGLTIRQYEEARAAGTIGLLFPAKRVRRGVGHKTADIKPAGASLAKSDNSEENPARLACQTMGWSLNNGVAVNQTINLDNVAKASPFPTLGAVMDDGVRQYQRMLPLTPKDMRLLNWHMANLEYANAANIGKLSLSGWDQDMGNEFEGEHSQVIGGYQQLPYGLFSLPAKLDVRTNKIVSRISYGHTELGKQKTVVHCEDGESLVADKVVFTGSLGVLKQRSIQFSPPLPDWKVGAIDRLGFGIMNKVILVFDQPFWDTERDMFGLLREPSNRNSMMQEDYAANRGRFYLFWNCIKTTGLPVLIALMAGDAAHQAENTADSVIIAEVTSQLRNVFKHVAVPDPLETIITRWGTDKFTRGSYSYVAAQALPGDYDLMAKPIGNLHFAGEATCGTHPATVHGAYLSGLRAASEVIESILGPIDVPKPLVPEKGKAVGLGIPVATTGQKRKEPPSTNSKRPSLDPTDATANNATPEALHREAYDKAMWAAIYEELGAPPPRPARTALNPFLLYQKDYWGKCRTQCDEARRAATNDPNAKAARDEIRQALGLMWRQASEEVKRPYLEQIEVNRQANAKIWDTWRRDNAEWEKKSYEVKDRWCAANPFANWRQPASSQQPSTTIASESSHQSASANQAGPSLISHDANAAVASINGAAAAAGSVMLPSQPEAPATATTNGTLGDSAR
ncbi:putative lysine-specific histone demethylase Aof2 [Aspergillus neoniger CBS 115656]|uniref:Lysine-specific histone demethylase Aof2 n=1 Tax=Aspergillus neoniger (strain CBS 115656) TaxID=1448310 RepID=A0A318Y9B1_ASPNB|nr:lysine-specific histone demethylase Aof2 [Aspergillus neoniger CBS 115656]PYH30891.1 lysine-specific histone demethylase Aof2 [Aspergillus neoniger CBS 115656]